MSAVHYPFEVRMANLASERSSAPAPELVQAVANGPRWAFFLVFAISGFSGLIYESIWSHYLKLFLGHAAYAQSLVLIIFMGGMAIGSWLAARFAARWKQPILVYAIVEGIIGIVALLFHKTFVGMADAFYFSILPEIGSSVLGGALKWTAASALILPQSVLLGMTFPLLSMGLLRRHPSEPGASLSMLYFSNSIGAAIGVLASGFWLIDVVGLPGTIMSAGLLNVALAMVVWALLKSDTGKSTAPVPATTPQQTAGTGSLAMLFFFAAGLTGAASFIYEIGWIRMLSLVLGSTTHSFELMLSAFITGLAFGGLWMKRRIDTIRDPVRFAGWVQVIMGVLAVLTIPLYVRTFDWMAALLSGLQSSDTGYTLFTLFSHGIALVVMVPATFMAGMTLPLFTHVLLRSGHGEGAIGRIYASNTLGSILGVLFAVHVGLPLLGLKSLIGVGAALDVALGLLLIHRSGAAERAFGPLMRAAAVGGLAIAVVAAAVHVDPRRLASGVYRYRSAQLDESANVVYYRDGKTASISLISMGPGLIIATNGKPDASITMEPGAPHTTDEITMVMAAALPLAYNPNAKEIANIGLGSGLTTHTFLADPQVERVDTIEIERAMVEAAHGFGDRVGRAFADPRSRIHLEDAKTFFSLEQRKYDVIVAEPSNPWVSGVASLFSQEFYRTVPNYLKPDGVFVQWLQLYEFNDQLAQSVLRALSQTFDDVVVYNTDNLNVLIVAKASGALKRPDFARVLEGALGADLAVVGLESDNDFLVRKSGSMPLIEAVLAQSGIPANSDYFPFLDLHAGRARYQEQTATMFRTWGVASLPVLEMLGMEPFDYEAVAQEPTFSRTTLINRAQGLHAAIAERQNRSAAALAPAATVVDLLSGSCDAAKRGDSWLLALHTVAEESLPFLRPADATSLVETALPAACAANVSPQLRVWTDLYRAVAARNAQGMVDAGEEALRRGDVEDGRLYYALSAAMLGHLAIHQPDRTLQLWRERPEPLQLRAASPDIELVIRVAEKRLADGVLVSQRPARP
jgi:predicted membrane-bound spermidine synthase